LGAAYGFNINSLLEDHLDFYKSCSPFLGMVSGALVGSTLGTFVSSNILNCIMDPTVKVAALVSKIVVGWILAFLAVVLLSIVSIVNIIHTKIFISSVIKRDYLV
jgi:hypothetical protein